jgi:hypothetical protein
MQIKKNIKKCMLIEGQERENTESYRSWFVDKFLNNRLYVIHSTGLLLHGFQIWQIARGSHLEEGAV